MFIDSGPGLAVILVGSLLAMLLIGSVVVIGYRRCRHREKRGNGRAISSAESAASNQNEPVSPVTIYYGETSFQPRRLTRGENELVVPNEAGIAGALHRLPAGGPAVTAAADEAASSAVAAAFAANVSVSTQRDSLQRSTFAAVAVAPDNPQLPSHSAHPERTFADKYHGSKAEGTKSLTATAAADRVPPRRSLASGISERLGDEGFSTARAITVRSDGGSSDHRFFHDNVHLQGDGRETNAASFVVSAITAEKYVEIPRRSSASQFPTAGMQRPLPLPPTALAGGRLVSSESSTGYADEVDSSNADQGRRLSSISQMSEPATALRLKLANDRRHLPRTSWSGPALQIPSHRSN